MPKGNQLFHRAAVTEDVCPVFVDVYLLFVGARRIRTCLTFWTGSPWRTITAAATRSARTATSASPVPTSRCTRSNSPCPAMWRHCRWSSPWCKVCTRSNSPCPGTWRHCRWLSPWCKVCTRSNSPCPATWRHCRWLSPWCKVCNRSNSPCPATWRHCRWLSPQIPVLWNVAVRFGTGFPLIRENRKNFENFFQSGKSVKNRGFSAKIRGKNLKSGKFSNIG